MWAAVVDVGREGFPDARRIPLRAASGGDGLAIGGRRSGGPSPEELLGAARAALHVATELKDPGGTYDACQQRATDRRQE